MFNWILCITACTASTCMGEGGDALEFDGKRAYFTCVRRYEDYRLKIRGLLVVRYERYWILLEKSFSRAACCCREKIEKKEGEWLYKFILESLGALERNSPPTVSSIFRKNAWAFLRWNVVPKNRLGAWREMSNGTNLLCVDTFF